MADVKLRMKLNSETPNEEYLDVDIYNGLKSVETTSQSTGQPKDIFYGSVESTGSATLLDINGDIEKKITNGELEKSNVPVTIIANGNTLFNHITYDSDYNRNSKTLNLKFGDKLNELDSMIFGGYPYPNESRSLYQILLFVMQTLGYSENEVKTMLQSNVYVSETDYPTVEEYIKDIDILYPVIKSGDTYRKTLDNICMVAQLNLFIDEDNNFKFVSARPIMPLPKIYSAIKIPKKNMFSNLDYNLFVTNKFDGVEINKTNFVKELNYNNVVAKIKEDLTSNSNNIIQQENTSVNYDYASYMAQRGVVLVVYLRETMYYYDSSITIDLKDSSNLKKITAIFDTLKRDGVYTYTNTYDILNYDPNRDPFNAKGNAVVIHSSNTCNVSNVITFLDFILEDIEGLPSQTSTLTANESYSKTETYTGVITETLSAEVKIEDNEITNLTKINSIVYNDNDTATINYRILVGKDVTTLYGSSVFLDSQTPENVSVDLTGEAVGYLPKYLESSIYGDFEELVSSQISDKSADFDTASTKVSIQGGDLLQTDTKYKGIPIANVIKGNILSDYQNGLSNATLDISASDYNTIENEKVKDWENSGEIIEIHDIVTTDSDVVNGVITRNWRVTGRTFRKNGVPMVNLELQEAKWSMVYGLLKTYNTFIGWNQLLENNYITVSDNSITGCDTTLLSGNLYIPNSITSIGRGGLRFSQLTAVNLPESITIIAQEAFRETKLKELLLPQSVIGVSRGICYQCENLEKVILPYFAEQINQDAFFGCIKLNNVIILSNVKTIYERAFKGCSSLTSLTFDKTNGWGVREVNSQTVIPIDVSDPVTNAQMITGQYADYVWVNNE